MKVVNWNQIMTYDDPPEHQTPTPVSNCVKSWCSKCKAARHAEFFVQIWQKAHFNSRQCIQWGEVSPDRGQKAQKDGCRPTNEAPAASKHNRPLWQQQGEKSSQWEGNRSSANKAWRVCFCKSVGPDTYVVKKEDKFTSQGTWTYSRNNSSFCAEWESRQKNKRGHSRVAVFCNVYSDPQRNAK